MHTTLHSYSHLHLTWNLRHMQQTNCVYSNRGCLLNNSTTTTPTVKIQALSGLENLPTSSLQVFGRLSTVFASVFAILHKNLLPLVFVIIVNTLGCLDPMQEPCGRMQNLKRTIRQLDVPKKHLACGSDCQRCLQPVV